MATYEAQTLARIETLVTYWLNNAKADDGLVLVAIVEELGI